MQLNTVAAENAIENTLAKETGLTPVEAAAGVHELVNENMASAARVYVAEKGKALSQLSLVAFGGAGPVHAVGLARKLGCPRVIIPPFSGVMSSLGLLAAPVAFERSQAIREILRAVDLATLETTFCGLEKEATSLMPKNSQLTIQRSVDLRYSGQDYPLEINVEGPCRDQAATKHWEERFVQVYHELYGKVNDDNPIELASIRVHVSQLPPQLDIAGPASGKNAPPKG